MILLKCITREKDPSKFLVKSEILCESSLVNFKAKRILTGSLTMILVVVNTL